MSASVLSEQGKLPMPSDFTKLLWLLKLGAGVNIYLVISLLALKDIRARVDDSGNEQGLLGLAFDPGYASNGHFYVYYTYDPPGFGRDRTRVSRFTVSADPNIADAGSELIMLEFEQLFSNHNGGRNPIRSRWIPIYRIR